MDFNPPAAVSPSVSIFNLSPGNYNLSVTNLVTGCARTEVVQVEDPGTFNFTVANTGACAGSVELALNSVPSDFDYEILDKSGGVVTIGSNNSTIPGLDPDTYFIKVTDNDPPGCVETEHNCPGAGA